MDSVMYYMDDKGMANAVIKSENPELYSRLYERYKDNLDYYASFHPA